MTDFDNLKSNEYRLLYMMTFKALQKTDTKMGILESLDILKDFLEASNVTLYKKFDNWQYTIVDDKSTDDGELAWLVNLFSEKLEKKQTLKLNESKNTFNDVFLLYLPTKDNKYVLVVKDYKSIEIESPLFLEHLAGVMNVSLNRLDEYEKTIKAINTDLMTGLYNRNSYNIAMDKLSAENLRLYGIFDLFRLKYINDNYGYQIGDEYIKRTADILKKYWPEYRMTHTGEVDSGNRIYRIGGDEFVLLTQYEGYDMTWLKASMAARDVSKIDLGIGDVPLGLNYGLASHNPSESVKETIDEADKVLQKDKRAMYQSYGLDRRK